MQIMVDAAKRLIAQKGSGFTTQELAREAGVALQTFYRQFGGKDQLLLATLEDMHAEQAAAYEEAARDIPDRSPGCTTTSRTCWRAWTRPGRAP
jgi:TetR/AcrR family transcriptional regulator